MGVFAFFWEGLGVGELVGWGDWWIGGLVDWWAEAHPTAHPTAHSTAFYKNT